MAPLSIEDQYAALVVSPEKLADIARLVAAGVSSEAIAEQMNMQPIDIDRLPLKYAADWDEVFTKAARAACQRAVFQIMAHAQVLVATTTEPKGLAALMQAIARFLKLPFLSGRVLSRPASESGASKPAANRTAAPIPLPSAPETQPTRANAADTGSEQKMRSHVDSQNRNEPRPRIETPTSATPEPMATLFPDFSDAEVLRCVELYHANPSNYVANLQEQEPKLYAKCVAQFLLPPPNPSPASPPTFTLTQRLKALFKVACVWGATWFGLTHPPHH